MLANVCQKEPEFTSTFEVLNLFNISGLQLSIVFAEKNPQNMASYIFGLYLISAFLSFLVASISEYYVANLEFDNKVPTSEPIDSNYADSLVQCAMLCGSGCKCFNFKEHTRMCRSYNSCNDQDKTVSEIGWRLYVKKSLIRNGEFEFLVNTISYLILIKIS